MPSGPGLAGGGPGCTVAAMTVRQHEHEPLPVLRRRLLVAGIVLFVLGVGLAVVVATSSVLQPHSASPRAR